MITKKIGIIILGILFYFSFSTFITAQSPYVGVQELTEYEWALSVYSGNWNAYQADDLEITLGNLVPLGIYNLTRIYNDWGSIPSVPQSVWPYTVTSIGSEVTGQIITPEGPKIFTSTPINGTAGYVVLSDPLNKDYWDENLDIANNTTGFLQQTRNLSYIFSVYYMMAARFAPTSIDWSDLVNEYLMVMNSKGGVYMNISATSQSNGFLIHVPILGFQDNSVPIDINVTYNTNGVLTYYEFSYGQPLLKLELSNYLLELEEREKNDLIVQYAIVFGVLSAVLAVEIFAYIYMKKL